MFMIFVPPVEGGDGGSLTGTETLLTLHKQVRYFFELFFCINKNKLKFEKPPHL